jgi:hypothetical protein
LRLFVVVDDGMLERFVAYVAFQAGVGILFLAEQAALLLFGRGRRGALQVAAVVAVPVLLLVHKVEAHEVLIGAAQPPRDGTEGSGGDDEQGDEGQQTVEHQRNSRMDGGQRRGAQESEHSAGLAQPVKSFGDCGLSAQDMGQAAAGEGHDEETDAHPVIAPPVRGVAEEPESTHKKHQRKQQRDPAERTVHHAVDGVREPTREAPPGEGGDKHAQGQVEEGSTVTALVSRKVADVMANAPHSPAHEVADAQPCSAHYPQQPGLVLFDGGELAGPRRTGAAGPPGLGCCGFRCRGAGTAATGTAGFAAGAGPA